MIVFTGLSNEKKHDIAAKLVVMDAIEKGHTNKAEIIEYVKSDTFKKAVKSYVSMM